MKTAVTLRDPQTIAKRHVDALLAASSQFGTARSSTVLPGGFSQAGVDDTLVVTRLDGWDAVTWPAGGRARIRVVCYDENADRAWDCASYVHGRLLASLGDEDTAGYLYNSGPTRDTDPDFDSPISAFTIIQKVKPQIIVIDDPSIINA